MLQKTTVCLLSALVAISTSSPAFAEGLGQSGWIKPDTSDYVPSGSFKNFLEGGVTQNTNVDDGMGSQTPMGGGIQGDMNQVPMNGVGIQGDMSQMQMNGMGMQGGMSQMQMNGMGMQGGMSQMPMNGMGMQGGMPGNDMSMMGNMAGMGGGSGSSGGADGVGTALAAAAAIGLAGQTALNGVGDALRGMGFGGGFRSHSTGSWDLSPFGGTGLGHRPPGRLGQAFGFSSSGDAYVGSSGGGGIIDGYSRNINRAINENVQSATDQVTNRLMYGLLWR